jgi:hypothetical protein
MLVGGNGVHYFVYQRDPAARLTILISTTDAGLRATEINRQIASLARGSDVALPPQIIKADPARLAKLADTPAGRVASAYFKAFNSGDENMMNEFIVNHLASASLASRPVEERLKIYRQMRNDLGDLEVESIAETGERTITVTLRAKKGGTVEFSFEMDNAEPHKLKSIQVERN